MSNKVRILFNFGNVEVRTLLTRSQLRIHPAGPDHRICDESPTGRDIEGDRAVMKHLSETKLGLARQDNRNPTAKRVACYSFSGYLLWNIFTAQSGAVGIVYIPNVPRIYVK